MATRWGIVGTGKISSDFVAAMKAFPAGEHEIVAVAARSLDNAKSFCNAIGSGKPYGSYDELAMDPNVEVAYIGTIHPYHLSAASLMLNNGKHVLCEKPLCMNLAETKQLVDLAREKKLFLMEAVWSRFFPVYSEMKRRIANGEIGEVVHVVASFGMPIEHVPRIARKDLGGGVTLDIGVYPLQFACFVMGGEKPQKVVASGHLNSDGVDETISVTLVYSGGRVATLYSGMRCQLPNEGYVHGTKGTLKIDNPVWCPESMATPSGKFESLLPTTDHVFNFPNSQGLMYEAAEVRRCLKEGRTESQVMSLDETLSLASLMEDCRKQVGVEYLQDEEIEDQTSL